MKTIRKIVPVLVVAAVLVAAWLSWPTTPVTIGLSADGNTKATLTIPARGTLPMLPGNSIWMWAAIGAVVLIILLILDLKHFGLFGIFSEWNDIVRVTWPRLLALLGIVLALGVAWAIAVNAMLSPATSRRTNGEFSLFNGQVITLPQDGIVDAESDGPVTLTNTQTGEVISSQKEPPRIGWPVSDYYVIPKQPIRAGAYTVNGIGTLEGNGDSTYERARFVGVGNATSSHTEVESILSVICPSAVWIIFIVLAEAGLFLRKGTKEDWEAIRARERGQANAR